MQRVRGGCDGLIRHSDNPLIGDCFGMMNVQHVESEEAAAIAPFAASIAGLSRLESLNLSGAVTVAPRCCNHCACSLMRPQAAI